jgi:hypothetical protein
MHSEGVLKMPTFRVKGCFKENAEDVELVIQASSYKDAERIANQKGILVSDVLMAEEPSQKQHESSVLPTAPPDSKKKSKTKPLLIISISAIFLLSCLLSAIVMTVSSSSRERCIKCNVSIKTSELGDKYCTECNQIVITQKLIKDNLFVAASNDKLPEGEFHSSECSYILPDHWGDKAINNFAFDIGFTSYREAIASNRKPCSSCCWWAFIKDYVRREIENDSTTIKQFDPNWEPKFGHQGWGYIKSRNMGVRSSASLWTYVDIIKSDSTTERRWFQISIRTAFRDNEEWEVFSLEWKPSD